MLWYSKSFLSLLPLKFTNKDLGAFSLVSALKSSITKALSVKHRHELLDLETKFEATVAQEF
jgi:hypothetical protein